MARPLTDLNRQKCDRGRPCGNCVKTSAAKCVYVDELVSSDTTDSQTGSQYQASPARIRNRLHVLESRIALLTQRASRQPSRSQRDLSIPAVDNFGAVFSGASADHGPTELLSPRLSTTQQDKHFISSSHWESILDDVCSMKHLIYHIQMSDPLVSLKD